jgi:hypothetical protein
MDINKDIAVCRAGFGIKDEKEVKVSQIAV